MTCCFIGHRNYEENEDDKQKIEKIITFLIENEKVDKFIFGSRSNFDNFCFDIVLKFQNIYKNIKLIVYNCKHEHSFLKSEKIDFKNSLSILKNFYNIETTNCRFFDERYYFEEFDAGKNSYIKRNEKMIKDSDYVVFYYKPNNNSKGTKLMHNFAKKKNKKVYNIYDKK